MAYECYKPKPVTCENELGHYFISLMICEMCAQLELHVMTLMWNLRVCSNCNLVCSHNFKKVMFHFTVNRLQEYYHKVRVFTNSSLPLLVILYMSCSTGVVRISSGTAHPLLLLLLLECCKKKTNKLVLLMPSLLYAPHSTQMLWFVHECL